VRFRVSASNSRGARGSLVDRGANGGVVGNDAHVILRHQRKVDVTGVDNHELTALDIVDASAKVTTQKGDAIIIMRQHARFGTGRTIHSSGQIEHCGNVADDRSMRVKGRQNIKTLDGFVIPLDIINGPPHLKMHPNTDEECKTLPHIILTSGDTWDPKVLDSVLSDKDDWCNAVKDLDEGNLDSPFDECGNYRHREPTTTKNVMPTVEEGLAEIEEQDLRTQFHLCSHLFICQFLLTQSIYDNYLTEG